ncbi:MFS transporter [Talaromyces proteolyticus]|uniref:MFS transporter n=1 Tax=Talaromyces proteolyticus TaxID=1131652 RepID=A0AAD4KFX0_9EURO|nr:MFS transporter [Talaromyces proteolyticus]KAH8690746.1 MFS transporter [Talaromyces proteolyticus]
MTEIEKNEINNQSSTAETKENHPTEEPALNDSTNLDQVQTAVQPKETLTRRRGLLPYLVLVSAPANSKEVDRRLKFGVTLIVSLAGIAAPLGSTILMPVLKDIAQDLNTTAAIVNLSVAFYSLAVAFTPLWWSYFSEQYGRRAIYLISFLLLAVFNVLAAVSVNIGMFIAMRLLAGGACASVQAVGAGTIADIWEVRERGKAMGIFYLGPILGPLIAPVIGGAVAIKWSWRSTQWVMVIYGFLVFILVIFLLPETSYIQKQQKEKENTEPENGKAAWKSRLLSAGNVAISPVKVACLLRFMPILITVFYTSITFAGYYIVNITVQKVFSSPPYGFSPLIVGLTYIPSALGSILGAIFGGRWTDHIMKREASKAGRYDENGNIKFRPDDRIMENVLISALLYPAAMLWFGWTADKHVFWFVLCLATFFYGFGMMLISNVMTTMLTEFVPKRSSTGVAVNNLFRNSLACVALVIADPLSNAIGTGWLLTLTAFICWLSCLVLIPMKYKADKWSKEMAEKIPQLSI